MHVKTYTGSTTSAVLANIKADLGCDAVILETRETQRNGRTEIVITAAVERANGASAAPFRAGSAPVAGTGASSGRGWKGWEEEWAVIKGHLFTLMKPELQFARLAPRQRLALEYLEKEGVEDATLLSLFESLLPDPQASIIASLNALVPVRSWSAENWPQRVQLIAGPFGCGKTTVLVRLALLLRSGTPGLKIWVVNADARRGGGRLLLKNYAQLCGLEYREADNALEFASVLANARAEGVDRIFVDLPGLPRGKSMPEMREYFGVSDPEHALHLVMTPQYGAEGVRSLAARYAPGNGGGNESIIWTKLDEAEKFGILVTIGAASSLPVSALSCGPELNDTLAPAHSDALWRLIFKQEMPCRPHPGSEGF